MTCENILLGPYLYLTEHPGKEFRSQMISAFNHWLQVPQSHLQAITSVIDMLHTASLLIDDVQDDSELRRGVPVAHKIFGVPFTINSANYVYFLALNTLTEFNNPKLVNIFTEEMIHLHKGQGMDIYWRDTFSVPTEEAYLEMIQNKTGGLLRLAVKLMQECSNSKEDYCELVTLIGVHFQIRDDYVNLASEEYVKSKGFCEDLTEGKFSFPIIHCISKDANNEMKNILRQRTKDVQIKKYAVELMRRTGSFDYTRMYLGRLQIKLEKMIEGLGGNQHLEIILKSLFV